MEDQYLPTGSLASNDNDNANGSNGEEKTRKYFRVTSTKRTAFITKLFSMVNDESTRHLITWSTSGDRFIVFNNNDFARLVLPHYFKHCNWASFVRQLNMYDFHKTNDSKTVGSNVHYFEFRHPAFNIDAGNRLHKIKRKNPKHRSLPKMKYSRSMNITTQDDDYEEEDDEEDEEDSLSYSEASQHKTLGQDNESPTDNNYSMRNFFSKEKTNDLTNNAVESGHYYERNNNPIVDEQPKTGHYNEQFIQEDLNTLMLKTERLEIKIDGLMDQIQYLIGMVNVQGEILKKTCEKMDSLKPKDADVIPRETRKPKKIHELLISGSISDDEESGSSSLKRRRTDKNAVE